MFNIVDTKDFFNSGCFYSPSEIPMLEEKNVSNGAHIPTRKEWEAFRNEMLTAYKEKYGEEYRNYLVTSIEKMGKIYPIINECWNKCHKYDNQFGLECLVKGSDTEVFDIMHLEFRPIRWGTAKYISIAN